MFRRYQPRTPSLRFRRTLVPSSGLFAASKRLFTIKQSRPATLSGKKKISGQRNVQKRFKFLNYMRQPTIAPFIAKFIAFFRFPVRELVFCQTIFGQLAVYAQSDLALVGDIFFNTTESKTVIQNQFLKLKEIPINIPVSFVFNSDNSKPSFARGSGETAFKKKVEKKTKLLCVILPSKKSIFLPNKTYCVLGGGTNFYLNTVVAGKWGLSKTWKKTLAVRGVAKNPVDHPNGGRTKAKQPEFSPWGWVAKRNKNVTFKLKVYLKHKQRLKTFL